MYFRTLGIILSQKNFGEADKLLSIYTKDQGKISCIAKGARRPRSRKSGHIELGNWCKIFVANGKNIDLLTEAEVKKAYGLQNLSPEKANKIYHILEIVNLMTPANQKNYQIYSLLLKFLNEIEKSENFNLISIVFKIKILSLLGYFSTGNIKNLKTKEFLSKLEKEDLNSLIKSVSLSDKNYLKLLTFLDSMIEALSERKLKTSKFVNGHI